MEPGRFVWSSRECWGGRKSRAGCGDLLACFRWMYGQWRVQVKAQSWLRTMLWAWKYHICKSTCFWYLDCLTRLAPVACLFIMPFSAPSRHGWFPSSSQRKTNGWIQWIFLSSRVGRRNHVLLLVRTWTWNSMGILFFLKGSPFPSARTQTRHRSTWNKSQIRVDYVMQQWDKNAMLFLMQ